jgi:hypothetical protein
MRADLTRAAGAEAAAPLAQRLRIVARVARHSLHHRDDTCFYAARRRPRRPRERNAQWPIPGCRDADGFVAARRR